MYPAAPTFTASRTSASSPEADTMRILMCGVPSTIRRVASTPETVGSRRSMSTTSGICSLASSIASPPSAASPTTVAMPEASRSARIPSRHTGWSSTTITRIPSVSVVSAVTRCLSDRQPEFHVGAPPGRGVNLHRAAEVLYPPLHALQQAELAVAREAPLVVAEAHPVVADRDQELAVDRLRVDGGSRRVRVLHDVVEGFVDGRGDLSHHGGGHPCRPDRSDRHRNAVHARGNSIERRPDGGHAGRGLRRRLAQQ